MKLRKFATTILIFSILVFPFFYTGKKTLFATSKADFDNNNNNDKDSQGNLSFIHDTYKAFVVKTTSALDAYTSLLIKSGKSLNTTGSQTAGFFSDAFCGIKGVFGSDCEDEQEENTQTNNPVNNNTQAENNPINRDENVQNDYYINRNEEDEGDDEPRVIYRDREVQTTSGEVSMSTLNSILASFKSEILSLIPNETTTIIQRTGSGSSVSGNYVTYERLADIIGNSIGGTADSLSDSISNTATGGTTDFNGRSLTISGNVTAAAFYGDGSNLTGINALPSQTSHSGKFLTTDGSSASWATISAGVTQLSGLSDVGVTTPTNKNILVADGDSWEARQLTISDLVSFDTDDLAEGSTNLFSQWATSGSNVSFTGGNVGIGASADSNALTVSGSSYFNGSLTQRSGTFSIDSAFTSYGGYMDINSSLFVNGPANYVSVGASTYVSSYVLTVNGRSYLDGYTRVDDSFMVTGTSYLAGNVGIGTNPSNSYALYVSGGSVSFRYSAVYAPGGNFQAPEGHFDSIYADSGGFSSISMYSGNIYMTGDGSFGGNVRIGGVGSGAYAYALNLDSYGYLTTSSSDERLKKNIAPIDSSEALAKMLLLEPSTFEWKENSKSDLGLIAQEVEEIFPELVFTNKNDGYKGINYGRFTPLLIASVQELAEKINWMAQYITASVDGIIANFKEVRTDKICVGNICVTEAEFAEVFGNGVGTTEIEEEDDNTLGGGSNDDDTNGNSTATDEVIDDTTSTTTDSGTASDAATTEEVIEETPDEPTEEVVEEDPVEEETVVEPLSEAASDAEEPVEEDPVEEEPEPEPVPEPDPAV